MDKLYSIEEANALLPHLAPALLELREKFEQAALIRVEMTRAASSNGGSPEREKWRRTLARVDELMERIQGWEVELRDISTGLVDFPAEVEGAEAYLCWRLGEPAVAHWHPRNTGFAGRQPL
ncbi:MAG: DUF2203 domain-containing protein [Actinomycetota bacterium]